MNQMNQTNQWIYKVTENVIMNFPGLFKTSGSSGSCGSVDYAAHTTLWN
jgi:hypothetical protein